MATMESNQTAVFSEDKANKQIHVEKTVEAPLQSVWDAWTTSEKLDQWWAPKPWKAVTKSMEFKENGQWLYSMQGPKGEVHWSKEAYTKIVPLKSFEAVDSFCDENGVDSSDFAKSYWKVTFSTLDTKTKVNIDIRFDKAEDYDEMMKMGFKEGFLMGLGNLDELIGVS